MKVWMCLNNGDPLAVSYDIALEHLGKSPKNYVIIKDFEYCTAYRWFWGRRRGNVDL
jgi:hypothetical protein